MVNFLQNLLSKIISGLFLPMTLLVSINPAMKLNPSQSPQTILLSPTATVTINPTPTPFPSPSLEPSNTLLPTYIPKPTPVVIPIPTPIPTPLPTSIPTPITVTGQQLDNWFTSYSNQFSVDRQKLWLIAVCESKLNPNAQNGDYAGLFQFSSSTWRSTRTTMNVDPDPALRFNPEEAIKTAAFKIATGGLSSWPNCGK